MYIEKFSNTKNKEQMRGINAWADAPFDKVSFSSVSVECVDGHLIPAATHNWDGDKGRHEHTTH